MMDKYKRLLEILRPMEKVLVAFSGGADSSFLLFAAVEALGKGNVTAATAVSPAKPAREAASAEKLAGALGVDHIIFEVDELSLDEVAGNRKDRCYHCKKHIFSRLKEKAGKKKAVHVLEASNTDDEAAYRPGEKAVREMGIKSPLKEAGLSKRDIVELSGACGLETGGIPPESCYLTRFPYDTEITPGKIKKVEDIENVVRSFGPVQVRARVYGERVRIEVPRKDIGKLIRKEAYNTIEGVCAAHGFENVTIDPEGYRSGRMDEEHGQKKT
ncbi:MAG: ATP-dependent sacrificial sulfur transferase LarE [Candidatus Omnitrophica bacterium]|nr:ATP-dependent sacrificial sulfur transferase LarE [Candidatus Omnitrophota bacterium]